MTFETVFNPSDSPVVVSERGHTIGGNEWGTVQTTDDVAKAKLDAGLIVVVDAVDKDTSSSAALAAQERTDTLSERSERVSALSKPKALTVARAAGLVVDDEDPLRPELDTLLVEAFDVDIPAPSAVKTTTSQPASGDK